MRTLTAIVFLFFFLNLPPALAQAKQKIILEVIINELPTGQFFFILDANNNLWADEKTLEKMRLRRQLWAEKKNLMSLFC
jgi:hypothetical protein